MKKVQIIKTKMKTFKTTNNNDLYEGLNLLYRIENLITKDFIHVTEDNKAYNSIKTKTIKLIDIINKELDKREF